MICIYGLDESMTFEEVGAIEVLQSLRIKVHTLHDPSSELSEASKKFLSKVGVSVVPFSEKTFSKISTLFIFGKTACFDLMEKHGVRPEHVAYSGDTLLPTIAEINAVKTGLIDEVFTKSPHYAAEYVRKLVAGAGRGVDYRSGYIPFCNPLSGITELKFTQKKLQGPFNVLQVFTQVGDPCFSEHWKMLCGVTVPWFMDANFYLLGYGDRVTGVAGAPYKDITLRTSDKFPKAYEESRVYGTADVLLQYSPTKTPFSFEGAKAILSGVAVVGADSSEFVELIKHGETGFIASTADEAAYFTSKLAWEPRLRDKIVNAAYKEFVNSGPGNADLCGSWWKGVV